MVSTRLNNSMASKYVLFGNFTLKETKRIMHNGSSKMFPDYIRWTLFNPCIRCGRDGHNYMECFSKKTIDGDILNDGWNQFTYSNSDVNAWFKEQENYEKKKDFVSGKIERSYDDYLEDYAISIALDYSYKITELMLLKQAAGYSYY
jgi:hypothetical protein